MIEVNEMSKTYIVYLPTGEIFIKAECVRTCYEVKELTFYNKDGYLLIPVAQFNIYNIYGWSEYHA